jgi:preprotein translocase subunit SecG
MTELFSALIILASLLLVGVVLMQNAKGGGLADGLSGASQLIGAKRSTDILEKLTWGFAIAVLLLSLSVNLYESSNLNAGDDVEFKTNDGEGVPPVQENTDNQDTTSK